MDQKEREAALAQYGIDPKDANATEKYRDARRQKYLKDMGIDGSAAQPSTQQSGGSSSQPATTANGQPIWWKDGQPYVQDANGKKVPYDPSKDVPLAMDVAHAENQDSADAETPDQSAALADPNAAGLMASADESDTADDEADNDESDDEDDENESGSSRGLMG